MHFLGDGSSQYQTVSGSEEGRDPTFELQVPKKHDGISRLALLAIMFLAQAMVLASTNAASYAFGKMRAENSLQTTSHAMKNNILGDSTSTYAHHDFKHPRSKHNKSAHNRHYWNLTALIQSDLRQRQTLHGHRYFLHMAGSSKTMT
jgi:hypothetical protein